MENTYLNQVMEQKAEVERDLKRKRMVAPSVQAAQPGRAGGVDPPAVEVRVTGWWRWKTVIVPPNAYVVQTRRGRPEPVTCGMGVSFRFNPFTDAFLVVPAAMQTIIVNANCICRERQGVLVQGYVQWIIDDFAKAYRKLDFSDPVDPMQVVNVQLREQAEATIKDAVATMGIDDVLADKQPIIVELTRRLRQVAEGEEGLGLRIVTIQIKEAVVSSARVWDHLQTPFRAERAKAARLAVLANEAEVRETESTDAGRAEQLQIEKAAHIRRMRAEADAAAFDAEQAEASRRARVAAEVAADLAANQRQALVAEAELAILRVELQLKEAALQDAARREGETADLDLARRRRAVENDVSPGLLQSRIVAQLPAMMSAMPTPKELRTVQVDGAGGIAGVLATVKQVVDALKSEPAG